ncbi:tetratricopeptide (TPR) repeat protein [Saccharothrix carnea]|uniref:Tetratricopeptide (TPR) repeat protein n=1 Tax=Saccharothrix carnea TaxID=1280637 RepID=A0A2P8I965_SACCR|nr:tetratricopeptide (TPR) repeat protein [Saccharothrix carnea]
MFALLAAMIGVVTNYVTDEVPTWFQDQTRVWLVFALIVVTSILAQVVLTREKPEPLSLPLVRPHFPATPRTLRPPTSSASALRGRDRTLEDIRSVLDAPAGRFVVVCGSGGMGKTALAVRVAEEAAQRGRPVFWIRWRGEGSSEGRSGEELLAAQMVQVAITLGLPEGEAGAVQQSGGSLVDLVWGYLERTPGWVLVIDNADRPEGLGIEGPVGEHRGWIRPGGAGLLLLTSRDRSPDTWGRGAVMVRLEPLSPAEGAQVLLDLAPGGGSHEDAERLATRLGGLPLALHAAGKAVAQPTARLRRFNAYLEALDDDTSRVLMSPDATDPEAARTLVGHTWELSLDQLAAEGAPLARPLLRALALLADAPIPRTLITPSLIPDTATDTAVGTATIDSALAGLERYGLVDTPPPDSVSEIGSVTLHPLVREASTMLVVRDSDITGWRDTIESHLIESAESWTAQGRAAWPATRLLAPHLLLLTDIHNDDSFTRLRNAIDNVADELERANLDTTAITLRRHVLDAESIRFGPDHPDTLTSQNSLALVLDSLGRYEAAEHLHRTTLTISTRVLGPDHPNTLDSQNNLALVLNSLGRYEEAEHLHRTTLTILTRVLGPDHPVTLAGQNNLANVLKNLGRYEEAEHLHRTTLTTRTRVLGPDHPNTLTSQNNLALVLDSLGRYEEAEHLHRTTLTIFTRVLGLDHPHALSSQNNLANVLDSLGRYEDAGYFHRTTLTTRTRVLGPDHPDTLDSQNNLALVLKNLGRYEEAEHLHRTSLDSYTRVLGSDHPGTLASQNNLANVLNSLGRYEEAEHLHRTTLTTRTRVLGPDHPDTLASLALSIERHAARQRKWWSWPIRRRSR